MKHSLIEPLEGRIAPAVLFSISPQATDEGNPGSHNTLTFSVTNMNPNREAMTLHFTTSDITGGDPLDNATAGPEQDYLAAAGDLVFVDGETSKTFTVTINGDTNFEHDEKFNVSVVDKLDPNATPTVTTGTIRNDEITKPAITIDSPTVVEGNDPDAPKVMEFKVHLSGASFETITATIATANGTALAGSDYTASNATLTFDPGQTEKSFFVPIIGDTISEADETLLANLTVTSPTTTSTTGPIQAVGTITTDDPRLEIHDATLAEDGGSMIFDVIFQGGAAFKNQQVSISYATSNGTAVATGPNADYTATSGVLTFMTDDAGNAIGDVKIVVPILNDTIPENPETFLVKLSNVPAGLFVTKGSATGTITDDDPVVVISSPSVVEGNLHDALKDMTFNVSIDKFPPDSDIELYYHTADGTAVSTGVVTAGTSDYVPSAANAFILVHTDANGHATETITVKVNGDGVTENNEFFNVVLDSAKFADVTVGGVTTPGAAIPMTTTIAKGTITDNDTTVITIGDATVVEGDSGQKEVRFLVTLTPSSQSTVTVDFKTVDGTATAAQDYTLKPTTQLTFAPGQPTFQYIVIPILGDLTYEGNETFTVLLSNAKLGGSTSGISIANDTGTGTIQDNETVPTVSVLPGSALEGNENGTSQLSFVAKLSGPSQTKVTVKYATQDGTATVVGDDYTGATGTIEFAPGDTQKAFLINLTGDNVNEGNETLSVQLSEPNGAILSPTDSMATGTILNDDITASIDTDVIFTEGAAAGTTVMTVRLSASPVEGSTVTVNFVLNGGTATLNSDIKLTDPAMTSLTFAAGETEKTIALTVVDDTLNEANETFNVTLTTANGAVILAGTGVGSGTIHDNNNDPQPVFRIFDGQITEGDGGTKDMTFKVTLLSPSGQEVKVHVGTMDGTAVAGSDYTALTSPNPNDPDHPLLFQEITFAAGETEKTVTVKILSDDVDEQTETFKVVLSDATHATIGEGTDAEAIGTITDDDLRAISIADSSIDEGATGDTHVMKFIVSIPTPAAQDITVHWSTVDGTAIAGTNYIAARGDVTILHGNLSADFTVDVKGNNSVGPDKTFAIALSNPVNATIADNKANGRIIDDESFYRLEALSGASIDEGNTTLSFRITRGGDRSLPGTVSFSTVDGLAHAGSGTVGDYLERIGTLNFAPGETEKTVKVTVRDDLAHEADENFFFTLTGSTGGVLKDGATVVSTLSAETTIHDNDAVPTISIGDVSIAEGNPPSSGTVAGTTDFTFTVSLSAPDEVNDVTVTYETIDGSGDLGAISAAIGAQPQDFTRVFPSFLTIPKGSLSATFVVQVLRDSILEGDETFTVKLSNPSGEGGETFAPGGDTATGTITNDDGTPTITFDSSSLTIVEGDAGETPGTFTVKLSKASEQTVTVNVSLVAPAAGTSGNATLGSDFMDTGVPTTLTFAPGETSKTLNYSILGDHGSEANETFTVKLSNAQGGTFGSSSTLQATATIKNDDPVAILGVGPASVIEGNNGETSTLVFTVTLDNESAENVTVDYTTLDIKALSSGITQDYQAVSGTLTFAPGEHTKTISVPIFGDDLKEGDETFSVKLSNATNATIESAKSLGIGTIKEDGDTIIGVTVTDVQTIEGDTGQQKNASFTVSLSGASDVPVTVQVDTRNGTAVAGADYTAKTTTLTFAPGVTTMPFDVVLKTDTVFEATESFFVEVKNPTNAVILDGDGRATIYNDDLQIVSAKTVRYVDADGDIATVHVSKGKLTTTGQSPVLNFSAVNNIGGRTLEMIDFTRNRFVFNHTNLSVTADLQPGFNASGGTSDGRVDVGYIQGGIAQGSVFQIFDNIDFGHVLVEGDLGKIVAGDQIATDRAIQSLTILSHGVKGTTTGAPDNVSIFLGGTRQISVGGDWNGALESVGGDTGDIESLKIKGALRGDSNAGSGQVFFTGTLKNAVIGSIVGGAGDFTGTIFGNFTNDATLNSGSRIGRIHVLGDIVGGAGNNSGRIFAPNIGGVIVDGSLKGGSGGTSGVIQSGIPSFGGSLGRVIIGGDVVGGAGDKSANSGEIFASKTLGTVVVHGSLIGGEKADSGTIVSSGGANTVKVLKDIVGGAGERSGTVQITKSLANFQLGTSEGTTDGNLKGGKGASSGLLSIGRDLKVGVIHGNIEGGTGTSSGGVSANGRLAKLAIGKDIIGGSTDLIDVSTISTSGYISANRVGALNIAGDIRSGTKADADQTIIASGTIRVFGDIDSLTVNNIVGNSDVPVVIAAAGAAAGARNQTIGALTVKGNVAFANILGGYSGGVSATNLLGNPLNPDAQMGTIKIQGSVEATNIVAGIDAGEDERFGTGDDQVITGGSADNPALRSRIAAVIIKGEVKPNTDPFGLVAQIIAAATIGNTPVDLKPHGLDELVPLGPADSKFFLHEVGLA